MQEGVLSGLYYFCPLVHKQEEAGAVPARVPPFHAAAFHPAKPSFPFAHFPHSLRPASGGTEELKKAVSVLSQRPSPEALHYPLGFSLPSAGGSPLEKNRHCPRCTLSLEQIYPVGPPSPSTGIYSWVSVPLRLTRCSWFCSFGVLALLLSFSPHPEPSSVSLQSLSSHHPCA